MRIRDDDFQMADLQVNGRVLAWARKERGITPALAARRLKWAESHLKEIESSKDIFLKQSDLRKIAKAYRVPYGSLFMPEPLPSTQPEQFRTFRGSSPKLGERTMLAWSDVNDAVDSFADLRVTNPELVPRHQLPTLTQDQDPEVIAARERVRLRVTIAEQRVWTEAQARNGWRTALGNVGVFVYFHKMPKSECMGFSVFDDREIPAICVNDDQDILERQKIYTMLHEYCHLLLRKPGISDQQRGNPIEQYCNRFAAAVLVPREALKAVLPDAGRDGDWTTPQVKRVANRFNVSMEVVALRIDELELTNPGFHARKIKEWNKIGLLARRKKTSHPNVPWPDRMARRLGLKHTTTVFAALDIGAITYREARELIGLAPRHFADVQAASTG